MLWGSRAIFLRLLVRIEENESMKEFVCFSTTNVFVPVSQLSTRDLFYFLGNLKIKQDMFVLSFLVSLDLLINKRYDSPIPDFLEQKCSRKC